MKRKLISHTIVFVLAGLMMNQGCKEEILSPAVMNLSDPNVKPAVIFTFPQSGSKGPYLNNTSSNYYSGSYNFFLQFNKLMDLGTFNSSTVTIEGFDEEVIVQIYNNYGISDFSDLIKFYVLKKASYEYAQYAIGKTYTVTVKSTVQDIHGYTLPSNYSFSFTPEPSFRVVSRSPSSDIVSSGSVSLSLKFNSSVKNSILSHIKISPFVAGYWNISGSDSTWLFFNPTADFVVNTPYTVEVDENAQDALNRNIVSKYLFTFTKKVSFSVSGVYFNDYQMYNSIYVSCNGAIDTTTAKQAFSITPSMTGKFLFYTYESSSFQFVPDSEFTPNTTYTVSISNTLKSSTGIPVQPSSKQVTSYDFILRSFLPSNSASVFSSIEMRLNYHLDTASARAAFSISPSIPGTLTAYRNYIHFIPSQALAPNTTYTVHLSSVLKTSKGYPLKGNSSYSFKTGS